MVGHSPSSKPIRLLLGALPVLTAVLLLSGCSGESYPEDLRYPVRSDPLVVLSLSEVSAPNTFDRPGEFPQNVLNLASTNAKILYDPVTQLNGEERAEYQKTLDELFGTPLAPDVADLPKIDAGGTTVSPKQVRSDLKLDQETLAQGSKLYRRHCLHCHGLTGDGRGPTAAWVNPHPRDYRQGLFKFVSSTQEVSFKPLRSDLKRTLQEGVEGTSMPSFRLLPDEELDALISYVIHLSIRGQAEFETMKKQNNFTSEDAEDMHSAGVKGKVTISTYLKYRAFDAARNWWLAGNQKGDDGQLKNTIDPPYNSANNATELQASVHNGWDLFKSRCVKCHYDYGRGSPLQYDDWGTLVRPADLTQSVYRGGRRPVDLFRRIRTGIPGANMPGSETGALADKQVWDLVNFLQALPYPNMLDAEMRQQIYHRP